MISCGSNSFRTKTHVDAGSNATWDHKQTFAIEPSDSLVFTVYNENTLSSDSVIGNCTVGTCCGARTARAVAGMGEGWPVCGKRFRCSGFVHVVGGHCTCGNDPLCRTRWHDLR